MNNCTHSGCTGILTEIFIDSNWISVCPVCGTIQNMPENHRKVTEADRKAGYAYSKARIQEYEEAERCFLDAYKLCKNRELGFGYLLWAVKCCYGVEYVCETQYANDADHRYDIYTPIFARFPYNKQAICGGETLTLFEEELKNRPHKGLAELIDSVNWLYQECGSVLQKPKNQYDVFIAWHDRFGSTCCRNFAKNLNEEIRKERKYCFASFDALPGVDVCLYEAFIYAAMATAKVFVIVIDDYQALGEKFLKWEILRMKALKKQKNVYILFNGMKGHIGQVPAGIMDGWERHYEDSEVTEDRVRLICRDVLTAIEMVDKEQKEREALYDKSPNVAEEKKNTEKEDVSSKNTTEGKTGITGNAPKPFVKIKMIAAFALAMLAVFVFVFLPPEIKYNRAADQFAAGEYAVAMESFAAMGDYRDADAQVLICEAMISIQSNNIEKAADILRRLIENGEVIQAEYLKNEIALTMEQWQEKGIAPEAVLSLLNKGLIDNLNNRLNAKMLWADAHIAMLDGTQYDTYIKDVNGDGTEEIVVLNKDESIAVYQMGAIDNVRIEVSNETMAVCKMEFGDRLNETNRDLSVRCMEGAYQLFPNVNTRAALIAAYYQCAEDCEKIGDMAGAIENAKQALAITGALEEFNFLYDLNLRYCKNGNDAATAIVQWEAFKSDFSLELSLYGAESRWQSDAAQLHLAYGKELVFRKDADCIAELRKAAQLGADISKGLSEAVAQFKPGIELAHLRILEKELFEKDVDKLKEIHAAMSDEVMTAITEWESRGIDPSDVPALIWFADQNGVDLTAIDRQGIYEKATVAAVGTQKQFGFVDWDKNGYQDLLTLSADGLLAIYGLKDGTWQAYAKLDTQMPNSTYIIPNESTHLVVLQSENQDELMVAAGSEMKIDVLFRETGLCRYTRNDTTIAFSRLLKGSIERYSNYSYNAVNADERPVQTGIDWQQNNYPRPVSATEVVQRYFEARFYGIEDEVESLVEKSVFSELFDMAKLTELPVPDMLETVHAAAYYTDEEKTLFEVTYLSGGQTIRCWVAAEYLNGWKVTGASDVYSGGQYKKDMDYSVELISLNEKVSSTLSAKGSNKIYRILVPSSGRLKLNWQSGTKINSHNSYDVTMYQGRLDGDIVFSYHLSSHPSVQQSTDMFTPVGVYYLVIEAKLKDADAYECALSFVFDANVEQESNNTYKNATQLLLNTACSGMLSSPDDIDYFAFELEEAQGVNISFDTSGKGNKITAYHMTVYAAVDGTVLNESLISGNEKLTETGNLYLSTGKYFVCLKKKNSHIMDEYALTVNTFKNGAMESEGNDDQNHADIISVNEDIDASFGREGDVDYFAFSLNDDAVVQPALSFRPTDNAAKTYMLTLKNDRGQQLLQVNIGGKEDAKVLPPVALTSGKYNVILENPRFVCQDYVLHMRSMPVQASEDELNNSAAFATNLMLGTVYSGVISSDTDVDYYKLGFDEQTEVTLKFSFAKSISKNTAYYLSIEQNGKELKKFSVKGESGGMEEKVLFPAGEYYLKVKPSTWLSAVYTIEVK